MATLAAQGFEPVILSLPALMRWGFMSHIIKLAIERVVYVFCNPAMLAASYRLALVWMPDGLSHTGYLESRVLFANTLGRCKEGRGYGRGKKCTSEYGG